MVIPASALVSLVFSMKRIESASGKDKVVSGFPLFVCVKQDKCFLKWSHTQCQVKLILELEDLHVFFFDLHFFDLHFKRKLESKPMLTKSS